MTQIQIMKLRQISVMSSNLFITNIDNTSDRERISTKLSFQIID
jgi:hypothetical protein